MRKFLGFGCALAFAATALADAAGYVVSDVVAVSRQPWDDTVDISFTVTPPPGATAKAVRLNIAASNGADDVYVSDASVSTRLARPSGRQTITWCAAVDHAGAVYGRLTFNISVAEEVAGTPPYMLLRLRDGAVSYADFSITNALKKTMFFRDYMAFRYVPPTTSDEWKALSGGSEYVRLGTPGTTNASDPHDAGWNYMLDSDILKESARSVKLTKGFYLAVYPMTWGQLEQMGRPRSSIAWSDTRDQNFSAVVTGLSYEKARGADTVNGYNFPKSTAVDPESIVGILRARSGLPFDLPTDAQWEYAARAGSTNAYLFTQTDAAPWAWGNFQDPQPHMRAPNAWGLYAMVGCCHQWTTTLGRTSDNSDLNAAANHNFWLPEEGAVDPTGPAATYDHGYRITRGSHFRAGGTTAGRDGKSYDIRLRVYRTGYKYPQKADKPAEEALCGVRLCLTLE